MYTSIAARRRRWARLLLGCGLSVLASHLPAVAEAQAQCERMLSADVVALDQAI
jgi:hypothetical protein